jgi:hypothetical protein
MAGKTFLRLVAGAIKEIRGLQSSAGAGNDGDLVALDSTGRIDSSMMPVGIGAETKSVLASENLAAGDWVNLYDNAGTLNVRKADATTDGKPADGFVLAVVASAANATVYTDGINTQVSGLTAGSTVFLHTTAGLSTQTAPSTAANAVQRVGKALSATEVVFERGEPVTLA